MDGFLKKFSPRTVSVLRLHVFQFFLEKQVFLQKWPFFNKLQSARNVARSSNILCASANIDKVFQKKFGARGMLRIAFVLGDASNA